MVGGQPSLGSIAGTFSLCPDPVGGMRELFPKGTHPMHETSTLMISSPPKDPHLLMPGAFRIRISGHKLGGGGGPKHSDHSNEHFALTDSWVQAVQLIICRAKNGSLELCLALSQVKRGISLRPGEQGGHPRIHCK